MLYKENYINQSGFTLLELLIVIAVLGLLAAIGIPQYHGYQNQAKADVSKFQYSSMLNLMGAELTKCSAGAARILENSPQATPCSENNDVLLSAFIAYGNAKNKNAYDSGSDAYIAANTPANGQTGITVVPGSTGNFTVSTIYLNSDTPTTLGPSNVSRE
jgi:type IV pilus assembly protein PilA